MTMTPEERAVINAAIEANRIGRGLEPSTAQLTVLRQAVHKLIFACSKCNAGGHTCPGDGNSIGHADSDCGEHDDDGPREDPLSGELIPAGQDAELERQGREIAAEGRRLELLVLQANALHHESQTEVSAGRSALSIDGVSTGAVLRERVTALANYHGSTTHLLADIDQELMELGDLAEDPPRWYARTMTDVRPGDTIRPKPGAPSSEVTARCWPPTDDVRGRGSWHVIEGEGGHWDDHVLQPGECCVHLDGAGHRLFRPTFGVEILLAPSEVQAIELLGGWEYRERMITE